jgi:hypothetical protein
MNRGKDISIGVAPWLGPDHHSSFTFSWMGWGAFKDLMPV